MQSVKVKKSSLLTIITDNRDKHRAAFEKALEGYRSEAIKILNDNLDRLKSNVRHVVVFAEFPPEDHTKDYDRVIKMLEMSVDDTVDLSANECQMFVQDEWNWKQAWEASNTKYLVHR